MGRQSSPVAESHTIHQATNVMASVRRDEERLESQIRITESK